MAKAIKLTPEHRSDMADQAAAKGQFPPLDDILSEMRYIHIEENRLPDDEDARFQNYKWSDLLNYAQRETGKTPKILMEKTLAGFPKAIDIKFYVERLAKSDTPPTQGFEWVKKIPKNVAKEVLKEIEKHVQTMDQHELADATGSKDPKIEDFLDPMHKVPMNEDIAKSIIDHRIEEERLQRQRTERALQERLRREEEARQAKLREEARAEKEKQKQAELEARAKLRKKKIVKTPDKKSVPTETGSKTGPKKLITINVVEPKSSKPHKAPGPPTHDLEPLASGIRNHVRQHKSVPTLKAEEDLDCDKYGTMAISQVDSLLQRRKVKTARRIRSFSHLKSKIGLIDEQFIKHYEPKAEISARDAFNMVADYAQLKDGTLPNMSQPSLKKKQLSSDVNTSQLCVAFQIGMITGWDELVTELRASRPGTTDRSGLQQNTPVPICLNDFMVATGFAKRNDDYDMEPLALLEHMPEPLPKAA